MPETTGTAQDCASIDAWMQGRIAAERGERRDAPCWFLPDDRLQWLEGWDSYDPT